MGITYIRAHFECDGCARRFWVDVDAASETSEHLPSIADIAEDALRGGNPADGECGSVQHDLHLCHDCTRKADGIGDENYQPTRDEILHATGAL